MEGVGPLMFVQSLDSVRIGLCQTRGFVVCDVIAAPFLRYRYDCGHWRDYESRDNK